MNKLPRSPVSRLLIPSRSSRVLTTSSFSNLLVPRTNLIFGSHSLRASATIIWNSLPDSIQTSDTFDSLWQHLKIYLFTAAVNTS